MFDIPERIGSYLRENISEKRFRHTLGTMDMTLKLAAYWDIDTSRAYFAALLHDCAKCLSDSELLEKAEKYKIETDEIMHSNPQLLHAPVGAGIARELLGVTDEAILSAISCHTLGKIPMNGLDKVLFLSDLIEPGRSFEGVYEIRRVAYEDLDRAVIMAFEQVIGFTVSSGKTVHPLSVAAMNYIKENVGLKEYSFQSEDIYVYEEDKGYIALCQKAPLSQDNEKAAKEQNNKNVLSIKPSESKTEAQGKEKAQESAKKNNCGDYTNNDYGGARGLVNSELVDKCVLITGAAGGIGRACAEEFAKAGWNIALTCRGDISRIADLAEHIRELGVRAEAFLMDVTSPESVEQASQEIYKRFGFIDALINNAGISQQKLFTDITEQDWAQMLETNLSGVFRVTQSVLKQMLSEKKGSIVNISSMWGQIGASCEVHYSAAKAGVIGLTKALAKEVGPSGIRVNCICPGVIDTPMNCSLSREDLIELCDQTPLLRIGRAEEVAKAAVFLSQEAASGFITGQILGVSGGMVI